MSHPILQLGRIRVLAATVAAGLTVGLLGPTSAEQHQTSKARHKRLGISEFVKDTKRLASLRKGVKKMRELESTDPRSWTFQANIHWRPFFPVYVLQQAERSKDPTQQLFRDDPGFTPTPNVFNQCPHGNWWFLPWHRAYLHYFERILRWAAEDPDLTLPYWNYADPAQRELPAAFREAKVGKEDNPLYLPESATFMDDQNRPQVFLIRDGPLLRGDTQLSTSATRLDALGLVPFTNAKPLPANQGFGSVQACDATCFCGFGALEGIPHNRLHTAIGGSQAQAGGSVRIGFMGDVSTAARDPIFWVHHANIDRLWASWSRLKPERKNPTDPEWLQYPFTFFDLDKDGKPQPVTVTPQDLLTTEQLGYVYDRLEQVNEIVAKGPPAPAPARGGPTFEPLAATVSGRHPDKLPHPPGTKAAIQLTTTKTSTLPIPLLEGVKAEQVRDMAKPAPGNAGTMLVLLEGIDFDQPPGVDYEVYLNLPQGKKAVPDSQYYLGTLTFFGTRHPPGSKGHGAHAAPRNEAFAVPARLLALLDRAKGSFQDLRVTFVPGTGTEPTRKGAPAAQRQERPAVRIRQVRLMYAN
jgi:tyrosinase